MASRLAAVSALAICAALAAYHPAEASPYDALYAFGDSLTDNGNLAEVYYRQNLPNPPSYGDSFTNGPVAVARLADSLGLPFTPSLWVTNFIDQYHLFGGPSFVPGTNFAVAGATAQAQATGGPPGINLPQQVAAFGAETAHQADPNALYVVMIGGNDVRAATLNGTGASSIAIAVATELAAVQTLADEGAKHFLLVNVPNVGVTPEFKQQNPTLAVTATALTQLYDAELAAGLPSVNLAADDSLALFDLYAFNTNLFANAASYGLTDTQDPCYTNTPLAATTTPACGLGAANIGQFAYWDAIHPTATVHALWAQGMEQALNPATSVPEPASAGVLAFGALLAARRRKARPV